MAVWLRYVYFLTGLTLDAPFAVSACTGVSRWTRTTGACPAPTSLDAATESSVSAALRESTDPNPFVRDITIGGTCNAAHLVPGAQVVVEGGCFTHVHPDEYSVYDFSLWSHIHNGNPAAAAAGRPNPIAKWAEVEGVVGLTFPASSHPVHTRIKGY